MAMSLQLVGASLFMDHDAFHGGASSSCRIVRATDGWVVSVQVRRSFPSPGERRFTPQEAREVLPKPEAEVAGFLARLADEYRVFEMTDRPCPTVFLHPTHHRFQFEDAQRGGHSFTYDIEAGHHHHAPTQRLVEEFLDFFEVRRVREALSEQRWWRPWWTFWRARS